VQTKGRDGAVDFKMIPLTLEDVLHPQFGDVHVLSDAHDDDCNYLKDVLKDRNQDNPSAVVLSDCGIFWDKPRLKHHSPDLAVIFGVKQRKEWKSFRVRKEGVRPSLIIEVTSPKTRVNDVETKVDHYVHGEVLYYVIVDAQEEDDHRRITLISMRLGSSGYEVQPLDERGFALLGPVELWLGIRKDTMTGGDRVALIDPETGEEIGDYSAQRQAREEAEARANAESLARPGRSPRR
jgi:Uma2 family endonuclease